MKITLKVLKEVAEELNEVFGMEPPIKTKGAKQAELQKQVEEAIALADFEEDEFSDTAYELMEELGFDTGREDASDDEDDEDEEDEDTASDEDEDEDEDDEDADYEDEEGLSLEEEIEAADLDELKELIKVDDALKPLRKGIGLQKNLEKLKAKALKLAKTDTDDEDEEEEEEVVEKKAEKKGKKDKAEKKGKKDKAEKKAEKKPKKESKKADENGLKASVSERVSYITPFIQKGKYTKLELLDMMCDKYPGNTRIAHNTILTDGKNVKYNKFAKLVVVNSKGKFSFKK